jgi:hypothetical protein
MNYNCNITFKRTRAELASAPVTFSAVTYVFFTKEFGYSILAQNGSTLFDSLTPNGVTFSFQRVGDVSNNILTQTFPMLPSMMGSNSFSLANLEQSLRSAKYNGVDQEALERNEFKFDANGDEIVVLGVSDFPTYAAKYSAVDAFTAYLVAKPFGDIHQFLNTREGQLAAMVWAANDTSYPDLEALPEYALYSDLGRFPIDVNATIGSVGYIKNVSTLAKKTDLSALDSRVGSIEANGAKKIDLTPITTRVAALETVNTNNTPYSFEGVSLKTAGFTVDRDNTTYVVKALPGTPGSAGATTPIGSIYAYKASMTASGSGNNAGDPKAVFKNSPWSNVTSGYGNGWSGNDVTVAPFRIIVDLGEAVQILGVEYQGLAGTGYPNLSSGPRATTFRFSSTPFTTGYNSGTGNLANVAREWPNQYAVGSNIGSFSGLGDLFDLRPSLGNAGVTARYMAIDVATSWDTHNSCMIRCLLHTIADSALPLLVTVPATGVKAFSIVDGNNTFALGQRVDVNLGVDSVRLTSSGQYDFKKSLTDKRWYAFKNGAIHAEGMGS